MYFAKRIETSLIAYFFVPFANGPCYESEIARMQDVIDNSAAAREVTAAAKRKEKLLKQLKECRDYDEKIAHLALARISLDLDDGVKVNYRRLQTGTDGKFYEVLADSKDIMAKE